MAVGLFGMGCKFTELNRTSERHAKVLGGPGSWTPVSTPTHSHSSERPAKVLGGAGLGLRVTVRSGRFSERPAKVLGVTGSDL